MDDDGVFTWVVTDFSTSKVQRSPIDRSGVTRSSIQRSDDFIVGGCKWALSLHINQYDSTSRYVFLYLEIPDDESLPKGWNRKAKVHYTIENPPPPLSGRDVKAVDFHAGNREDCLIFFNGPLERRSDYQANRRLLIRVKISDVVAIGESETVVNAPVNAPSEDDEASSASVHARRYDHSPIVTPCIEILLKIIERMKKAEISEDDLEIITAAVGHLKSMNPDKLKTLSEKIVAEAGEATLTLDKLFM